VVSRNAHRFIPRIRSRKVPRVLTVRTTHLFAPDTIRFPMRVSRAVWVLADGPAWLVLAGDHGWLHGSRSEADRDARWLSLNLGLPIRAVAP
jgi:hypothetical protein